MRRIRFAVATSLDGFIAGPKGEADWIAIDPEFDFDAWNAAFDTVVMGRRSFETAGGRAWGFGMKTVVISRTLRQEDHPDVIVVGDNVKRTLNALRKRPGKDIWLFGGGELFRSLLEMGLVDTVEVGVMPALLGDGVPLFPPPFKEINLKLTGQKAFKLGAVQLEYVVQRAKATGAKRKTSRAVEKKKSTRRAR